MTAATLSAKLQTLQRQRAILLKSRIMQANRLQAVVAGTLGYQASMPEKERTKKFKEASDLIRGVAAGEPHPFAGIIRTTLIGVDAFDEQKATIEKEMVKVAKQLPAAEWVKAPEQRGFGLLFLAIVVGECGDLANYANPAKVWRRMGCAPWAFDGKVQMGATWRGGKKKEDKLPASEWESFGYSPRRRSIAYLIGEGIVKQNTMKPRAGGGDSLDAETGGAPGPYRTRYDEAKASAKLAQPDWPDLRCHRHGMLLATKRLLRDLWVVWNKQPTERDAVTEAAGARLLVQA